MNDNSFRTAGILVFVNLFIIALILIITFLSMNNTGIIKIALLFCHLYLTIKILDFLKLYINSTYQYNKSDRIIDICKICYIIQIMFTNIVIMGIIADIGFLKNQYIILILPFLISVPVSINPFGLFLILLSIRLFNIYQSMDIYFRVFLFATLFYGFTSISFVFGPLSIFIGLVSKIFLGMIFLRPEREVEFV
ncbi:hypothetical protein ACFL6G_05575 [candidate division KSB1 bacterium]